MQRVLESILAAINPFSIMMQLLLTATDNLIPIATNLDQNGPNGLTQAVNLTDWQQLHCKVSDRLIGEWD